MAATKVWLLGSQRLRLGIWSHTAAFWEMENVSPWISQANIEFLRPMERRGILRRSVARAFPLLSEPLWIPFRRLTGSWEIKFFKSVPSSEWFSAKGMDTACSPSRDTKWHLQVELCLSLSWDGILLKWVSVLNLGNLKCLPHRSCVSPFPVDWQQYRKNIKLSSVPEAPYHATESQVFRMAPLRRSCVLSGHSEWYSRCVYFSFTLLVVELIADFIVRDPFVANMEVQNR